MKRLLLILFLFFSAAVVFVSCQHSSGKKKDLSARIDSLKDKINTAYVPGVGEIMNGIIQPHHYKLWLAGKQKNWALAEYERHMLSGGFKRIQIYHNTDPVTNDVPMIFPEMDSLEADIKQKDTKAFKNHFILLTNACNTCHQATKYEFNVITVPTTAGFGNQKF
jgi:hypothetical protein